MLHACAAFTMCVPLRRALQQRIGRFLFLKRQLSLGIDYQVPVLAFVLLCVLLMLIKHSPQARMLSVRTALT